MDDSVLFHYTSVDAFYSILGVEESKICVRATHARFMNDPKEYDYAYSILKESMIKFEDANNINEKRKSSYLFRKDNIFSSLSEVGGEPYLLSFSKHPDDLSM